MKLRLLPLFFIAPALIIGCGGSKKDEKKEVVRVRPCETLTVEDQQIGCDQGTQFMTIFASALIESSNSLKAGELTQLGLQWCNSQYLSSSLSAEQSASTSGPRKRVQVRNDAMGLGCKTAVEESLRYSPVVVVLLSVPAQAGANANPAYEKSKQLVARLANTKYETEVAANKLTELTESQQALQSAKLSLVSSEATEVTAKQRAAYLTQNSARISAQLEQAKRSYTAAIDERETMERQIAPLISRYNDVASDRESARSERDRASSDLVATRSQIATTNLSAAAARSHAAQLRADAATLR